MKPDEISLVLNQLARGSAIVRQVIFDMPPELRTCRPGPSGWA